MKFAGRNNKAYSFAEYTMMIAVIISALILFHSYMRRAYQGQMARSGETFAFGRTYSPQDTSVYKYDESINGWYSEACYRHAAYRLFPGAAKDLEFKWKCRIPWLTDGKTAAASPGGGGGGTGGAGGAVQPLGPVEDPSKPADPGPVDPKDFGEPPVAPGVPDVPGQPGVPAGPVEDPSKPEPAVPANPADFGPPPSNQ